MPNAVWKTRIKYVRILKAVVSIEHRDEEGWAGEGGTLDVKVLAAKPSDLSLIPRTYLGKKERANTQVVL